VRGDCRFHLRSDEASGAIHRGRAGRRRVGLRHTQFADAAVATIRLKLLKLGAQVRSSVGRLHFALASGCPNKVEFEMAYLYLRRAFNSS
jgi:hypothetical protein